MISNQASRNGLAQGHRLACRGPQGSASVLVSLVRVTGASALALALCASAPYGALAQEAPPVPGASIRKTPDAAPASADDTAATSTPAPPANAAPAAETSASPSSGDAAGATASAQAPAALATPAAHAKARTKSKAGRRAHADGATESAAVKKDSKAASAGTKGDKDANAQEAPFSSLQFSGNKGPIDIKSDTLDLDYKANVVTFRGHVHAVQADATLTSDTLKVTYGKDFHEIKEMVANNNVRMSQGTRWATGDHAVLDQAKHTVTLTGSPVVHDGEDQVTGTKITVHLDTGKSEVEGARAVIFPQQQKTRDNKTTVAKSP
ncbi:MAG TPA: LptA/OstA family protein [Candidatus Binataceae bacterium]|nr:LptA/OstA family protein [Candidatus Binataceae bacterium]